MLYILLDGVFVNVSILEWHTLYSTVLYTKPTGKENAHLPPSGGCINLIPIRVTIQRIVQAKEKTTQVSQLNVVLFTNEATRKGAGSVHTQQDKEWDQGKPTRRPTPTC